MMWSDLWTDNLNAKNLNYGELVELLSADSNDEIIINDVSEGEVKKIQAKNLVITNFPSFVISDDCDLVFTNDGGFVFYDA